MKNIFVYGTLKKGYGNHPLLGEGAEFIGNYVVHGFKLYESSIPYMKRTDDLDNDHVLGEIYEVDERCLRGLDRLEGHPTWYRREAVNCDLADVEGYVYLPEVSCKESPKVDGVYVYGRTPSW